MGDFVKPEPHRIPLHGGQFIDIKKRLTHGEREDMHARMSSQIGQGLDRREYRNARALAYLLGWSLTDEGTPVAYSPSMSEDDRRATLCMLDPDRFDEIYKAITDYEEAAAAQKKILSGSNGKSETSPSLSAAVGPSTTSAPLTQTTTMLS